MPSQAQMAYHSSPACWSGTRASVTPARCTRVHPGCIPVLFFSGRRLEEKQPSSAQGSRMPPRACSSQFCHVGPLLKHRRDPSAAQSSDSRRPDLASRRGDCRPLPSARCGLLERSSESAQRCHAFCSHSPNTAVRTCCGCWGI